jgi:hypothetical protein
MPEWLWIQEVVFPLIGMAMGAGVLYGIYRTANRLIDRKQEREALQGGAGAAEVEQLRARVEALEELSYRLHDVEERVDFTERVLTQQRERDQLPPRT